MITDLLKWLLVGAGALVLAPFVAALVFILFIAAVFVWSFVFNFTLAMFILMVQVMA